MDIKGARTDYWIFNQDLHIWRFMSVSILCPYVDLFSWLTTFRTCGSSSGPFCAHIYGDLKKWTNSIYGELQNTLLGSMGSPYTDITNLDIWYIMYCQQTDITYLHIWRLLRTASPIFNHIFIWLFLTNVHDNISCIMYRQQTDITYLHIWRLLRTASPLFNHMIVPH